MYGDFDRDVGHNTGLIVVGASAVPSQFRGLPAWLERGVVWGEDAPVNSRRLVVGACSVVAVGARLVAEEGRSSTI